MTDHAETYYDVLKVDKTASPSEISAAYQSAKSAFSKDSLATYSLFSPEEANDIVKKLEEAYQVLSNIERKQEYDRFLSGAASPKEPIRPEPSAPSFAATAQPVPVTASADSSKVGETTAEMPLLAGPDDLRLIREKRGLSAEDVARITKIPMRYLKALESCDVKKLPARVYIQGFLKNLCSVYKLDQQATVKAYLEHFDSLSRP
jgi:curved DNA-binding protein CbpA